MRLLIAGSLNGQLSMATKIALDRGAQVSHTETMQLALSH